MNDIKTEIDLINKNTEIKILELQNNKLSLPTNKSTIEEVIQLEVDSHIDSTKLDVKNKGFYIICFISTVLIFFGFYKWYFKTQKFNDIILKNESEKLKENKNISIHKLQFEKEFELYNELWKLLIELKAKAGSITRVIGFLNEKNKLKQKQNIEEIRKVNEVLIACGRLVEQNRPFFLKKYMMKLTHF